jgi:hypothetical protein
MAAFQGPTLSEKDYLDWRCGLIAFELDEKTTAVECSYIRLQQDQIRLMLKNRAHIRALRRHNVVPSARKLRYEPRAQIVSDAKQENLWHVLFYSKQPSAGGRPHQDPRVCGVETQWIPSISAAASTSAWAECYLPADMYRSGAGQKQLVNLADFSLPWLRGPEVLQFSAGVVPT